MNRILIFLFTLNIFFLSCQKEDIQCTTFPCGSDNPEHYNYNRVAYDTDFRLGTWANIRANANSLGTLVFHNDNEWSFYNELGGYYNESYSFNGIYLVIETDVDGSILNPPIKYQTHYNDTSGIFSILQQHNLSYQSWDHYIKIE